jgi:hypothetical protein
MKVTALALVAVLLMALAPMSDSAQQQPTVPAQPTPWPSRSYIQVGKPGYEFTSLPNGKTRVSWKVDISNTAGRYQLLEVQIRFFDDQHAQVLEDTIKRVYVGAASTVIASHETLTDGNTAGSIRTAEVSARQTGKAQRSTPAAKTLGPSYSPQRAIKGKAGGSALPWACLSLPAAHFPPDKMDVFC